ncbi:chalcone-flavanone isomerase-domain-containing protein [Lipomyces kononenkoae]|uniref:Chalcone-flavanone isomerase-domain-containing protein n=1 Tax=Lipomyces kononenkoae TaxID=34357 RepID=A0ACC3SYT1_LIPKO
MANFGRYFFRISQAFRLAAPGCRPTVSRAVPAAVQPATLYTSRGSSVSPTFRPYFTSSHSKSNISASALFLAVGPFAYYLWVVFQGNIIEQESAVDLEPQSKTLSPDQTWKPDTSVDPFMRSITIDGTEFWLLGLGVRTVSFLKMHVYAVGIYVAKEDIPEILKKVRSVSSDLDKRSIVLDNELGVEIFNDLLQQPVRFALKIVPVRNTDFGHLRDGFVRSVMASIKSHHRVIGEVEPSEGINQLRSIFSRKLSVPKNGELIMAMNKSGALKCTYSPKKKRAEVLGEVTDRNVVKALLLHYLAGPQGASEQARVAFADSVALLLNTH